jgi:hypothetical protein
MYCMRPLAAAFFLVAPVLCAQPDSANSEHRPGAFGGVYSLNAPAESMTQLCDGFDLQLQTGPDVMRFGLSE